MSVSNPERVVTKQDLKDFYDNIRPYMGGSAAAGFTPVGTVISVMGVNAPANYLICDGTVYNIADYPELANHFLNEFGSKNKFGGNGTTTFAVPDLRGEFLRGTGSNGHSGQGNGAAVGTHQNSTQIPSVLYDGGASGEQPYLNFPIGGNGTASRVLGYVNPDALFNNPNGDKRTWWNASSISSKDIYTEKANGMYSTRPTNTSVLFCIATKNIYLNPQNDYSTDEKIIGTWVTGETIYQKTVMINTVPSSGNALWVQIEPTLDVVVDYSAIVYSDVWSSVVDSISTQDATSSSYFKVYVYNYKWTDNPGCAVLINNIATAGWDDKKAFITVKYTKKTS